MRDKLRYDEQHKAVAYQRRISPEMREQQKRDRKQAADAAATFVRICVRGNADQLYDAHQWLNRILVDHGRLPRTKFVARVHHSELESEPILLRTVAPRDAILVVRNTEGDWDDGEVVVDPFRLGLSLSNVLS